MKQPTRTVPESLKRHVPCGDNLGDHSSKSVDNDENPGPPKRANRIQDLLAARHQGISLDFCSRMGFGMQLIHNMSACGSFKPLNEKSFSFALLSQYLSLGGQGRQTWANVGAIGQKHVMPPRLRVTLEADWGFWVSDNGLPKSTVSYGDFQ